jgi:hypothetical protein
MGVAGSGEVLDTVFDDCLDRFLSAFLPMTRSPICRPVLDDDCLDHFLSAFLRMTLSYSPPGSRPGLCDGERFIELTFISSSGRLFPPY